MHWILFCLRCSIKELSLKLNRLFRLVLLPEYTLLRWAEHLDELLCGCLFCRRPFRRHMSRIKLCLLPWKTSFRFLFFLIFQGPRDKILKNHFHKRNLEVWTFVRLFFLFRRIQSSVFLLLRKGLKLPVVLPLRILHNSECSVCRFRFLWCARSRKKEFQKFGLKFQERLLR